MIRYLKHREIDFAKWNRCIESSFNGKPYAISWYLNLASPNWDALVLNNYEAVMPLTHRKKFGISYIYQPIMCQQLGVFSRIHTEPFSIDSFIETIPKHFKYIEIAVNSKNTLNKKTKVLVNQRINQLLNLNASYQNLYKNFSKSHKKNIEKSFNNGITIDSNHNSLTDFLKFKFQSFENQKLDIKGFEINAYANLLNECYDKNLLKIYMAKNDSKIVSGAAFIIMNNRVFIQSFSTDEGKRLSAIYLLIDRFIKDYENSNLILDFMGSIVPGINYRNKGFGSAEEKYDFIKINRLPWPLKTIKK